MLRTWFGDREIDLEGGPLPGLAVEPDRSRALADDAEHGGKSEPGSLSRFLGREERLEDARLRRRIHAAAGVGYGEEHVRPGPSAGVLGDKSLLQLHGSDLDGQLAAARHR